MGIDFISRKLGLYPSAVIGHWRQRNQDPNWQRHTQEQIDTHDALACIKRYSQNKYLRDQGARQWMAAFITNGHAKGRNNDEVLAHAYKSYAQALAAHKIEQREQGRGEI